VSPQNRMLRKLMEEWLLLAITLALILSSLYLERIPSYTADDFKVLYILFVFLVIVRGLEESGFLNRIVGIFESFGNIGPSLVLLTAILSVFVTYDVALLVVVPITLSMNLKDRAFVVIMETLAANGASAISPFGNPQNIFIYYRYGVSLNDFMAAILPFVLVSMTFVMLLTFLRVKGPGAIGKRERLRLNGTSSFYIVSFVIFVFSILRILPLWLGAIPLLYAIVSDRNSLKIDYLLLATFFVFFGFTDNISSVMRLNISGSSDVFISSALSSQIMSNVPSTLLLADFTANWKALLWGVSVGGFGCIIGSMANLISYRFYKAKLGDAREFLIRFHIYSYAAFFLGIVLFYVLLIFI